MALALDRRFRVVGDSNSGLVSPLVCRRERRESEYSEKLHDHRVFEFSVFVKRICSSGVLGFSAFSATKQSKPSFTRKENDAALASSL
jgi:hypothetical protein